MSKTFKSPLDGSNYRLGIGKASGAEHISLWISNLGVDSTSVAIAPSDAPALALAILEAVHPEVQGRPNRVHYAIGALIEQVEEDGFKAAEAEAQAELEAEALMLANSAVLAVGNPPYPSIEHMSDTSLRKWLAVARRAREINKETPNA